MMTTGNGGGVVELIIKSENRVSIIDEQKMDILLRLLRSSSMTKVLLLL